MSEDPSEVSSTKKDRRNKSSLVIFLGVLTVLFVFICVLFVHEYLLLKHRGMLRQHPQLGRDGASLRTISNIEKIENWMTFDYINTSFRLPPEVLKEGLNIMNPHYPRMSIRRAAREQGVSREEYLAEVKKMIQEYLLSKNIP